MTAILQLDLTARSWARRSARSGGLIAGWTPMRESKHVLPERLCFPALRQQKLSTTQLRAWALIWIHRNLFVMAAWFGLNVIHGGQRRVCVRIWCVFLTIWIHLNQFVMTAWYGLNVMYEGGKFGTGSKVKYERPTFRPISIFDFYLVEFDLYCVSLAFACGILNFGYQ